MKTLPWLSGIMLAVMVTTAIADESFRLERNVEYVRQGEDSLKCDVRVPNGNGPFPAVLCVHGGAWLTGCKEHMNHIADKLAERGYTAVSINYRLAPKLSPQAMVASLKAAGVEASLHLVPRAGHMQAFFDKAMIDQAVGFLDKQLKADNPGK